MPTTINGKLYLKEAKRMREQTKNAFTLAETLITLVALSIVSMAAVGVVAKKNAFEYDVKDQTGFYECRWKANATTGAPTGTLEERIKVERRLPLGGTVPTGGNWKDVSGTICVFEPAKYMQYMPTQSVEFMTLGITGSEGSGQKLADITTDPNKPGQPNPDGKLCAIQGGAGETKIVYYPPLSEAEMKNMLFEATLGKGVAINQSASGSAGKNGQKSELRVKNTKLGTSFTITAAGGLGGRGHAQKEGDSTQPCYDTGSNKFQGGRTTSNSGIMKISW